MKKAISFLSLMHLLHLLMKFTAVWSIGVAKHDNFILGVLVTHYKGIFQGDLGYIDSG